MSKKELSEPGKVKDTLTVILKRLRKKMLPVMVTNAKINLLL